MAQRSNRKTAYLRTKFTAFISECCGRRTASEKQKIRFRRKRLPATNAGQPSRESRGLRTVAASMNATDTFASERTLMVRRTRRIAGVFVRFRAPNQTSVKKKGFETPPPPPPPMSDPLLESFHDDQPRFSSLTRLHLHLPLRGKLLGHRVGKKACSSLNLYATVARMATGPADVFAAPKKVAETILAATITAPRL